MLWHYGNIKYGIVKPTLNFNYMVDILYIFFCTFYSISCYNLEIPIGFPFFQFPVCMFSVNCAFGLITFFLLNTHWFVLDT